MEIWSLYIEFWYPFAGFQNLIVFLGKGQHGIPMMLMVIIIIIIIFYEDTHITEVFFSGVLQ